MKPVKGLMGQPHWSHRPLWDEFLARHGADPDNFCHHNCKFREIYPTSIPCPVCPECGCEYIFSGGMSEL